MDGTESSRNRAQPGAPLTTVANDAGSYAPVLVWEGDRLGERSLRHLWRRRSRRGRVCGTLKKSDGWFLHLWRSDESENV